MELAQSLDLLEIGKAIGSIGAPALLGGAVYVLWGTLKTERAESAAALKAAQDKLDAFQERALMEQKALIMQLTGGK